MTQANSPQPSLDDEYQIWLGNNALTLEKLHDFDHAVSQLQVLPKISIIMPTYNTEPKWLKRAIESVASQIYPRWELCAVDDASTNPKTREILAEYASKDSRIKVKYLERNMSIGGASNEALDMAGGDFAGFLDHDGELTPDACLEVVKAVNRNAEVDYLYSDEDKLDENGTRVCVFFKPDWSPDTHLSMNYVLHFSVVRMSLLREIGGFREGFDGSQDYDLLLRVTEKARRIHHIAKPLYSWRKAAGSAAMSPDAKRYAHDAGKKAIADALRRRGIEGEAEDGRFRTSYRVRYKIQGRPLISVLVPIRDRVDLLRRCLESVKRVSTYSNYEVIVIDHQSENEDTRSYLRSLEDCTVVRFEGEFNYSRLNNFGADHARGNHLLFLNNDVEVVSPDWMESMLEHSQRHEVGAVGSKLVFPDGRIQHAGDIVGIGEIAAHAFYGLPSGDPGYFGLPQIVRNCSCVTAACMMVRRAVFEELAGLDERLRVEYGDVDFCLRVGAKGYRVIYTPYAVLRHEEGGTRGREGRPSDPQEFRRRWHQLLRDGDPYYNPNLDRLAPYRIRLTKHSSQGS